MCTGFVKKGDDLLFGYNLDLGEGVWDYGVYARKDRFFVGIRIGASLYKTHGVTGDGAFGVLPYMNDPTGGYCRRGKGTQRVDLLVNGYLSGHYDYGEARRLATERELVNVPKASLHALLADRAGHILLAEPGLGCREPEEDFAVVSNFPLLRPPEDLSAPWYGKDRYDRGRALLGRSGGGFSVEDGLSLLRELRQEGPWATRVSFIYSAGENAVYYVRDNDFEKVSVCRFA